MSGNDFYFIRQYTILPVLHLSPPVSLQSRDDDRSLGCYENQIEKNSHGFNVYVITLFKYLASSAP